MGAPGGGSPSGEVNYPPHLMMWNQQMMYGDRGTDHTGAADVGVILDIDAKMTFDMVTDVAAARSDGGGSPYASVVAYDPTSDLSQLEAKASEAAALVVALNPLQDIQTIFTVIKAELDTVDPTFTDPFDAAAITALVNAFDAETKTEHNQRVSRTLSGHFDVRSMVATGSGMAVSILEDARTKSVGTYRAQLENQRDQQRFQQQLQDFVMGKERTTLNKQDLMDGVNETVRLWGLQVQSALNMAGLQDGVAKTTIVAKTDQTNQDLVNEVKDALWDLDLYAYTDQITSSIAGAATMPRGLSDMERNIGMLATVAGIGLQLFTIF